HFARRLRRLPRRASRSGARKAKSPTSWKSGFCVQRALAMTYFLTGNPQYHRRDVVSRSCSGWEGVGPTRYGRQEFWNEVGTGHCGYVLHRVARGGFRRAARVSQGYRVKPHGQLVLVSSTHCCAYTPSLSTSWSRTTLQGGRAPGRSHLQA